MTKDEITKIVLGIRDSGITSCAKIAIRLNEDSVPTVSGKGKWERKMVSRILDAADPKPVEKPVVAENLLHTATQPDKSDKCAATQNATQIESDKQSEIDQLKMLLHTATQNATQIESDKQKEIDRLETLLHTATQKNIELESALCNATQKVTQIETDKQTEIDLLKSELDDIKADNTALNNLSNRHMIDNQNLRADVDRLESENKIFRAKIDSLNRSLVETESKYKTLYESQLKELGNKLASANDELEKVKHNQKLIELETSRQTNLDGWTINRRSDGKINMIRRISGKNITVYVGNEFDADIARRKIKAKLDQLNPSAPAQPAAAAVPTSTQISL